MTKVFLYVEFQTSCDFSQVDASPINQEMKKFPGLRSKTWLSGINNHSLGGFYEFDSVESAKNYVENFLRPAAENYGSLTVKMFDGDVVADASKGMNSPFYS